MLGAALVASSGLDIEASYEHARPVQSVLNAATGVAAGVRPVTSL